MADAEPLCHGHCRNAAFIVEAMDGIGRQGTHQVGGRTVATPARERLVGHHRAALDVDDRLEGKGIIRNPGLRLPRRGDSGGGRRCRGGGAGGTVRRQRQPGRDRAPAIDGRQPDAGQDQVDIAMLVHRTMAQQPHLQQALDLAAGNQLVAVGSRLVAQQRALDT